MITKDIRHYTDFNDVKDTRVEEYLQSMLEDIKVSLVNCSEEDKFRTLQGKAQAYTEILKEIDGAKDSLIALRQQKDMSKAF